MRKFGTRAEMFVVFRGVMSLLVVFINDAVYRITSEISSHLQEIGILYTSNLYLL